MDQSFSDAILPLVDFPMIGRIGSVVGTREIFPHESYRLVYEIFGETIWVLALVHTAQAWPPVNDEGRD